MSRLHYDQPIEQKKSRSISEDRESKGNSYLSKIAQLIPGEVIAGYLAMVGFVPMIEKTDMQANALWGIFIFCQILTPIYFNSQADEGKPKKVHILVSSLAFTVWAFATTGEQLVPEYYDTALASILLVAFSLVSGKVPLKK